MKTHPLYPLFWDCTGRMKKFVGFNPEAGPFLCVIEWCFNWFMGRVRLALIKIHQWWKWYKLCDSFSSSVSLPLSWLQMTFGATTLLNSGISNKYLKLVGWHQQQPACFWLLFKDHQDKGSAPPSSPGRTSESQLTTVKLVSVVPEAQWNSDYRTNFITSCSFKECNTQRKEENRKDTKVAFSDLVLQSARFQAGPIYQQEGKRKSFQREL